MYYHPTSSCSTTSTSSGCESWGGYVARLKNHQHHYSFPLLVCESRLVCVWVTLEWDLSHLLDSTFEYLLSWFRSWHLKTRTLKLESVRKIKLWNSKSERGLRTNCFVRTYLALTDCVQKYLPASLSACPRSTPSHPPLRLRLHQCLLIVTVTSLTSSLDPCPVTHRSRCSTPWKTRTSSFRTNPFSRCGRVGKKMLYTSFPEADHVKVARCESRFAR